MKALKVTDNSFSDAVLKADKPALVDFWATWCGPCIQIAPVIEALAEEYSDRAVIAKLDVDENQATAQQYGVMSIPTLLFFKNGQVVDKLVGAVNKKALSQRLEAIL